MKAYVAVLIGICFLIIGFIFGFILAKKNISKQLKNNPPITKDQIRSMYNKMGRKPTEAQINQIMKSMEKK